MLRLHGLHSTRRTDCRTEDRRFNLVAVWQLLLDAKSKPNRSNAAKEARIASRETLGHSTTKDRIQSLMATMKQLELALTHRIRSIPQGSYDQQLSDLRHELNFVGSSLILDYIMNDEQRDKLTSAICRKFGFDVEAVGMIEFDRERERMQDLRGSWRLPIEVSERLMSKPDVGDDKGGFVVPESVAKELLKMTDNGHVSIRTVKVDMAPRTVEEVCKLRGVEIPTEPKQKGETMPNLSEENRVKLRAILMRWNACTLEFEDAIKELGEVFLNQEIFITSAVENKNENAEMMKTEFQKLVDWQSQRCKKHIDGTTISGIPCIEVPGFETPVEVKLQNWNEFVAKKYHICERLPGNPAFYKGDTLDPTA